MPKAILLSIRPNWAAKILNGEKTIEIRKQFPKDFVGWVYIYCTLDTKNGNLQKREIPDYFPKDQQEEKYRCVSVKSLDKSTPILNGKVCAIFWCNKVEYVESTYDTFNWGEDDYMTDELTPDILYKKSCLTVYQLKEYLNDYGGYAIHITKLEIFETPKELGEFKPICKKFYKDTTGYSCLGCPYINYNMPHPATYGSCKRRLTKAPQNLMFIEIN